MCGILGCFGYNQASEFILEGLSIQQNRGKDAFGISNGVEVQITDQLPIKSVDSKHLVAHSLHSIVSHVAQPLQTHSTFVMNGEIYNWKNLSNGQENDSQVLHSLLDEQGLDALEKLNGVYAFCYWNAEKVILARDIIGEKPLHYFYDGKVFAFSSERKTLLAHFEEFYIQELNPRTILTFNTLTKELERTSRPFFTLPSELTIPIEEIQQKLEELFIKIVIERVPEKSFGVLFSGGIDSTLIAFLLKKMKYTFPCYVAGLQSETPSEDVQVSIEVAKKLDLDLHICSVPLDEVDAYVQKIIPLIESSNVVKVGVALPFFICCEKAQEQGIKVIFSGLGSEEIFAGYERHTHALNVNKECISGLRKMYERDLYRDDVITMHHTIEIRLPFLDTELIEYALQIPQKYKMDAEHKKIILRQVCDKLGIPSEYSWRPKKAAQYGSRFDKALQKLAKKKGFKKKADYLDSYFPFKNQKLAVLFSTGKDSHYAAYIMERQHYPLSCLITIESENKDSYMFHTPTIEVAQLQADAMQIPLLIQKTTGEKEKELEDLEKAIILAKETYNIDGIVTGALYSTYQRERVEIIAEKLGLKVFSPLWHIDQEEELKELIQHNFTFILTKVAAEGLDKSWLNVPFSYDHIHKLSALNEKIGLNVAGEGGEFESLVLDCPLYKKKLVIEESQIREDGIIAELIIKKAKLK